LAFLDIFRQKEYTYTYEDGKIARAAECSITVGDYEIITGKNLVNSIIYVYDAEGNMTRKRIIDGDGNEQTVYDALDRMYPTVPTVKCLAYKYVTV